MEGPSSSSPPPPPPTAVTATHEQKVSTWQIETSGLCRSNVSTPTSHRSYHGGDDSARANETRSKRSATFLPQRREFRLTTDSLGDGNLIIREFRQGDNAGVQAICFGHFRSLCFAAVRYYIAEHFQDLAFLTLLGWFLIPFKNLLLIMVVFNLYLFLKSRWEMEQYIRRDCQDLRDISKVYFSDKDPASRFWVAEVTQQTVPRKATEPKSNPTSGGGGKALVGCVGLVASRENPSVAKLVRLVVDRSHRRMRIGSRLLFQLENCAREVGYHSVRIYTNTLNPSHMKFVRQHGYTIVQTIRRGLMRGDLVTWHKVIGGTDGVQEGSSTAENGSEQPEENIVNFRIRSAAQHVMD